ncbi:MAG: hypothetical protein WA108_14295 [Thiobacillus sp.]
MLEVIALSVFVPFAVRYMKVDLNQNEGGPESDFLWASLCLMGAVYYSRRPSHAGGALAPMATQIAGEPAPTKLSPAITCRRGFSPDGPPDRG